VRSAVKNGVIHTNGEYYVQHDDVKEETDRLKISSEYTERERQKMTHIHCDKYSMRYITMPHCKAQKIRDASEALYL